MAGPQAITGRLATTTIATAATTATAATATIKTSEGVRHTTGEEAGIQGARPAPGDTTESAGF